MVASYGARDLAMQGAYTSKDSKWMQGFKVLPPLVKSLPRALNVKY